MDAKNFKVGQKWKTRDGDVVEIIEVRGKPYSYPLVGNDGITRLFSGHVYEQDQENESDLVELVEDVAADPSEHPCAMVEAGACQPGHCATGSCETVEVAVASIPAPPKVVIPSTETLALLRKQANTFNQHAADASQELQALVKSRENIDKRIAEVQAEYDKFIKAKDETRAFVDSIMPA